MAVRASPARLSTLVPFLTKALVFPAPSSATRDGLLAVGGDLSIPRLLLAYSTGIFPWPIYEDLLTWFCPDPRAVLPLDQLHVSKSLAKKIRQGRFEIRFNTAFRQVMQLCAQPTPKRPSTWIIDEMFDAYVQLHEMGYAHSVEAWDKDELVGGLYGVSIGGVFSGESMFARQPDASKIALHALVQRMKERALILLDVQVMNPHLESLGATEIRRVEYLRRLAQANAMDVHFGDVRPSEYRTPSGNRTDSDPKPKQRR